MIIKNIDELREKAGISKTELAKRLGVSRAHYYKMAETGEIEEAMVYENYDVFGMEKPVDYYRYTPESLLASMNFYKLRYSDFTKLWGEEYGYQKIWRLTHCNKSLYYLKDLFDATFHPVIVPCEMLEDGTMVPVKAPKSNEQFKELEAL